MFLTFEINFLNDRTCKLERRKMFLPSRKQETRPRPDGFENVSCLQSNQITYEMELVCARICCVL